MSCTADYLCRSMLSCAQLISYRSSSPYSSISTVLVPLWRITVVMATCSRACQLVCARAHVPVRERGGKLEQGASESAATVCEAAAHLS